MYFSFIIFHTTTSPDFGISAKMENGQCRLKSGTRAYMAHEHFVMQPHGIPSDFYSVGVLAFELASGKHPFKDALHEDVSNFRISLRLAYRYQCC